jgi:hypothetical protein
MTPTGFAESKNGTRFQSQKQKQGSKITNRGTGYMIKARGEIWVSDIDVLFKKKL